MPRLRACSTGSRSFWTAGDCGWRVDSSADPAQRSSRRPRSGQVSLPPAWTVTDPRGAVDQAERGAAVSRAVGSGALSR